MSLQASSVFLSIVFPALGLQRAGDTAGKIFMLGDASEGKACQGSTGNRTENARCEEQRLRWGGGQGG